ncbi:hypothetical protein AK88_00243 [Plasmodium fragile]|uniref:FHA domain-containing protein n=1 Tax=Plasmodium fragile TaxID=5857 RepID=A0A0D9QSR0_PLAFR|nr:uncharacterized protein AK88_00243 [Plasmodium fragile]KJP90074.1 hypothetical protein AK88_00243 [Plasmodium fragile]
MDGKTVECTQYTVHAERRGRGGSGSPSSDTSGRSRSGRRGSSCKRGRRSRSGPSGRSGPSRRRGQSRDARDSCDRPGRRARRADREDEQRHSIRNRRSEHRCQNKQMTSHGKRKTRADQTELMQSEDDGRKREHISKKLKRKNRSSSRSHTNEEPTWERKKKYYQKEKNKMFRDSRRADRSGFPSYDSSSETGTGQHNEYDNRHRRHREDKHRRDSKRDKDDMHSYDHEERGNSSENVHVKKDEQKDAEEGEEANTNEPKEKKNFNPSGLLAQDKKYKNGVELKYIESIDAELPDKKWRLYVFLNANTKDPAEILHLHRKSCYLIGKDDLVVDIKLANPSISKQHAIIQFKKHESEVLPFLLDLSSTNGSYLNNDLIEPNKYYELRQTDILRFGSSAREYVLLHDSSDDPAHA